MDVLTSETCWAVDNKASVIQLVNLYSNIKMMHGPIRIRFTMIICWSVPICSISVAIVAVTLNILTPTLHIDPVRNITYRTAEITWSPVRSFVHLQNFFQRTHKNFAFITFKVFTVVNIHIVGLWVFRPCGLVGGYQSLKRNDTTNFVALRSSETSTPTHEITVYHNPVRPYRTRLVMWRTVFNW